MIQKLIMEYQIVIEKAKGNYSAYSPDLPGCVATGVTEEEAEVNMREAIELHLEWLAKEEPMRQDYIPATDNTGKHIKDPTTGLIMYTGSYQLPQDSWTRYQQYQRAEAAIAFVKDLMDSSPVTAELLGQLVEDIPGARQMAAHGFGITEKGLQWAIENKTISIGEFVERLQTEMMRELPEEEFSQALALLSCAVRKQITKENPSAPE